MRTGVKKQDKITKISFNEASPIIDIRTHNTDLKKRLTEYSRSYPDLCKLIYEDAEIGYMEFQIVKPRLSFRLTAPYSEERKQAASENARINGIASKR